MSDHSQRAQFNSDLKKLSSRNKLQKIAYYFTTIALLFVFFYIVNTEYLLGYNVKVNITTFFVKTKARSFFKPNDTKPEMKHILLWTSDKSTPFVYFGKGQTNFLNRKCKWTNCYVTADRNYLGYYTEFDVVAFNGPQLSNILSINDFPKRRSIHQKYVYANIESAGNYQIYTKTWNEFFNWTWTYKLNSDAIWGYLIIRNATEHVIGPSTDMHWMKWYDMDPIDDELKKQLKSKRKAAAWFSSNCHTASLREDFVKLVQEELKEYGLHVDIYGTCGKFQCPRDIMDRCLKNLKRQYYFYFAFENAFSADYVTEKIVYALNNNVVPVVYGTANYSRYLKNNYNLTYFLYSIAFLYYFE